MEAMDNLLKYKNILLCTDYSEDAEASFIQAFDQAKKYNATLHVLNVIPAVNPCSEKIFEPPLSQKQSILHSEEIDQENKLQALGALKKVYFNKCRDLGKTRFAIRVGSPDMEIIRYAQKENIDMIIMGTAGRQEAKRLTYVRTAANVSKFADCQVITIGNAP